MELVLQYLSAHAFIMAHRTHKDTCFSKDAAFGEVTTEMARNDDAHSLVFFPLSSSIFPFQCVHGRSVELHRDQLLRLVISL